MIIQALAKTKRPAFLAVLLVWTVLSGAGNTTPIASDPPSGKSGSHFLQGRITHSETLPALADEKDVGKLFDPRVLLEAHKTDGKIKRFVVPHWLAGTWSRHQSTEISRMTLPDQVRVRPGGTSTTIVNDSFGTFRDPQGKIWQTFDPKNATGEIDRGSAIDYHAVFGYQLVVTGAQTAVVEVQAAHAVVDKKTGKIRSFYQDEELNTYSLVVDGQLRTDSSVKVFDWQGKAEYLARSISSETKVAPFKDKSQPKPAASATKSKK